MTDILKCRIDGRVATLTLNRPEHRNALSPELSAALICEIRKADADPAIKVIVIQGEGEHFSAGGDVKGFQEALALSADERFDLFDRKLAVGNRLPKALLDARKPVVVVTRGAVAGAGMALCLAADFVLAADTTYFVAAHVLVGLSLDCGLSGLLVAAMGIKAAKRLALLGERVSSAEALALGIVTRVLPSEELESAAADLAQRLAAGPGVAMAETKALLNHAALTNFPDQLAQEAVSVATCAATEDFRKGILATLARKSAEFD
jgi:2-(1,2-epoxy-1,2-dihydrophenyl)acetyl-CoA isomerase